MQNAPFTVKHITPDGDIMLYPAALVSSIGAPVPLGPGDTRDRTIALPTCRVEFDMGRGDGLRGSIDSGVVYVLNQNGRTVDAFHVVAAAT